MALAQDYDQQDCPVARALELVGERWTLLIIRDCFLGVSRFNDFLVHLDISRATLSARLDKLVEMGILKREEYRPGYSDYALTDRGEALWSIVYGLAAWGDAYYAPSSGRRRVFSHTICGTVLDESGACRTCGVVPPANDVEIRRGPGSIPDFRVDPVENALIGPHRLLTRLSVEGVINDSESEPRRRRHAVRGGPART
jgi:DNA-binding HxlR family transcriptional regulator